MTVSYTLVMTKRFIAIAFVLMLALSRQSVA